MLVEAALEAGFHPDQIIEAANEEAAYERLRSECFELACAETSSALGSAGEEEVPVPEYEPAAA